MQFVCGEHLREGNYLGKLLVDRQIILKLFWITKRDVVSCEGFLDWIHLA
jgi:hypothetical protein